MLKILKEEYRITEGLISGSLRYLGSLYRKPFKVFIATVDV